MSVQFSDKVQFLFEPHPYKILWGGRDGIKSWSVARALLIMGAQNKIRFLMARETQSSVAESVHQLLEDQIIKLGLTGYYRVEKARIVGTVKHQFGMYGKKKLEPDDPGFSEFVFCGLRHNVSQIKSFESLDGIWCEESNAISKNSWETVLPTLRQEGAEVIVTFNPELATDDCYRRWVLNPPPGAVVVRTSFRDNMWLSESSRIKIDHLRNTDPVAYDNIYEGNCKGTVDGAIFAAEMKKCTAEGRICSVPYNPTRPVDTAWDLGFDDNTAIFFVQPCDGWWHFIDYLDGSGLTISDYIIKLQNRGYVYGTHFLPHDSVDTIIHRNLAGGNREMSIEQLLRKAYPSSVRVVPKMLVSDQLNAARTLFSRCRFDADKCADGLQSLRHYRWPPPSAQGVAQRKPLHDWASHGSSAFCYAAVAIKSPPSTKAPAKQQRHQQRAQNAWV